MIRDELGIDDLLIRDDGQLLAGCLQCLGGELGQGSRFDVERLLSLFVLGDLVAPMQCARRADVAALWLSASPAAVARSDAALSQDLSTLHPVPPIAHAIVS